MVEGELLQLTRLGRADVTEEEALDLSRRKTARLFQVCLELGALLGGLGEAAADRVGQYGLNRGPGFQIVDDVLDFPASRERLGKPVGNDLREGNVALPPVYPLQAGGAAARRR